MKINVKLLTNDEKLVPTKNNADDAGFDLKASHGGVIAPGGTQLIKCGFSIEVPIGFEAQVRSRSGLALKSGMHVLNAPGTIDAGYRGEVGVILHNTGTDHFIYNQYDRVAQMVINQLPAVALNIVTELSDSSRGENGFGSSGLK